jgi:hypothetical protein
MGGRRWFGHRSGGWGWCPANRQGWIFTIAWLTVSVVGVLWLIDRHHPGWIVPWAVVMVVALAVVVLLKGYPIDSSDGANESGHEDR